MTWKMLRVGFPATFTDPIIYHCSPSSQNCKIICLECFVLCYLRISMSWSLWLNHGTLSYSLYHWCLFVGQNLISTLPFSENFMGLALLPTFCWLLPFTENEPSIHSIWLICIIVFSGLMFSPGLFEFLVRSWLASGSPRSIIMPILEHVVRILGVTIYMNEGGQSILRNWYLPEKR